MTFEQFQATRKHDYDLSALAQLDHACSGYRYHGDLHIFDGPCDGAGTKYELVIGNDITLSDDLEELERKLYAYGQSEGAFE